MFPQPSDLRGVPEAAPSQHYITSAMTRSLADRERLLEAIFQDAPGAMIVTDDALRVVDANPSAFELFGYAREDFLGRNLGDLLPTISSETPAKTQNDFRDAGDFRSEREICHPNGSRRTAECVIKPHFLPGRHLFCFRDITPRKRAEESLRRLSLRLMKLRDEERRRIGRELHDGIAQCVAAIKMNLDLTSKEAQALTSKAQNALEEARMLADQCTADLRTACHLLHPPLLDEAGLPAALRWFVEGFAERSGVQVELEVDDEEAKQLPMNASMALFRVVQEGLTNVHRHSQSAMAKVCLTKKVDGVCLEIRDWGCGMPDHVDREGSKGVGVGIAGMRERLREFGGALEIAPGQPGTVIRAKLPVEVLAWERCGC